MFSLNCGCSQLDMGWNLWNAIPCNMAKNWKFLTMALYNGHIMKTERWVSIRPFCRGSIAVHRQVDDLFVFVSTCVLCIHRNEEEKADDDAEKTREHHFLTTMQTRPVARPMTTIIRHGEKVPIYLEATLPNRPLVTFDFFLSYCSSKGKLRSQNR